MHAIFDAQTAVLGHPPCSNPFDELIGAEESVPVRDAEHLRRIILALPLVPDWEDHEAD